MRKGVELPCPLPKSPRVHQPEALHTLSFWVFTKSRLIKTIHSTSSPWDPEARGWDRDFQPS